MGRIAVIMAGGSGERFWPLSRKNRPKQLLPFGSGGKTLLQEAVERALPLFDEGNVRIATGPGLAKVIEDSGLVSGERIWVEPAKRNTLGALVWVTANLIANGEQGATVAVLTADHFIGDPESFREFVGLALNTGEKTGGLVTLGIRPTRPETGYGYIEVSPDGPDSRGITRAKRFREKPPVERAREYLAAGNFLWNSGMFFWTVEAFLRELSGAQPEIFATLKAIADAMKSGNDQRVAQLFETLPDISVDFALMEKAKEVYVVEADFPWDDLGAWDALSRTLEIDASGNAVHGDVLAFGSADCVIYNDADGKLVAAYGLEGLVVVATDDAVLVCSREQAQGVRDIVEELKKRGDPRT